MTDDQPSVASAANRFHEDVPHRFQVSLTMSMDTRENVSEIRDALNDEVGKKVFTTDDVMRLALLGAARYHAVAVGDTPPSDDADVAELIPLTATVRRVLDDDSRVPELRD